MHKIKFLIMAVALTCIAPQPLLFAQETNAEEERPSTIIATVPQYLIMSGLRVDIDKRLPHNPYHWISFSPMIYSGNVNQDYDASTALSNIKIAEEPEHDVLSGAGLGIHYKIFLKNDDYEENQSGFYFGYGLTYNYFRVDFKEIAWKKYEENGLELYQMTFTEERETIHLGIASVLFGYRMIALSSFVADIYGGFGIRRVSVSSTLPGYRKFNRFSYDYGYQGNSPQIGLRLGFIF